MSTIIHKRKNEVALPAKSLKKKKSIYFEDEYIVDCQCCKNDNDEFIEDYFTKEELGLCSGCGATIDSCGC